MNLRLFTNGLRLLAVLGILLTTVGFAGTTQAFAADLERGGPGNPRTPANPAGTRNGCANDGTCVNTTALAPLSPAEAEALKEAILEEYGAQNLYQSVINQYGAITPFSRIVKSEAQHASALIRQANKYGVAVPAAPAVPATTFTSIQAACQAGVAAEKADAALYDELKKVTTHADLLRVYTTLQSASLNNHLPAFQACQ